MQTQPISECHNYEAKKNLLLARRSLCEAITHLALGMGELFIESQRTGQERFPMASLQETLAELELLQLNLDASCKQIVGR